MFFNTPNQKLRVFAWNLNTGVPATGEAANITCDFSLDYTPPSSVTDTNPTEVQDGFYHFDLTATETSGVVLEYYPSHTGVDYGVLVSPGLETQFQLHTDAFQNILLAEPTGNIDVGSSVKELFDKLLLTTGRKQTLNKDTGVQTYYDSTGNSGVMTSTHADDGTTYSVTAMTKS